MFIILYFRIVTFSPYQKKEKKKRGNRIWLLSRLGPDEEELLWWLLVVETAPMLVKWFFGWFIRFIRFLSPSLIFLLSIFFFFLLYKLLAQTIFIFSFKILFDFYFFWVFQFQVFFPLFLSSSSRFSTCKLATIDAFQE